MGGCGDICDGCISSTDVIAGLRHYVYKMDGCDG